MAGEPFSKAEAARWAKRMLFLGAVSYSRHANLRQAQRRLEPSDIENVIEAGWVYQEGEPSPKGWTYVVETPQMAVCIAFRCDDLGEVEAAVVVSAWRKS